VSEQTDLSKALPDVAAKLHAELNAWQKQTHAPIPTTPNPEYDLGHKPRRRR
jgi:hypothetical protein